MPWIKCLGGAGGKPRRGKPLSVSQPIHLLVKNFRERASLEESNERLSWDGLQVVLGRESRELVVWYSKDYVGQCYPNGFLERSLFRLSAKVRSRESSLQQSGGIQQGLNQPKSEEVEFVGPLGSSSSNSSFRLSWLLAFLFTLSQFDQP
ncbi:hypothetical protein M0804_003544 [Polistes exclamans]|nr:hypothetical protein M0804_003544 [Polistes exclamans]